MTNCIYYTYAYLRVDGTPYYIGKGKDNRAFADHGYLHVPKDRNRIIFLETNLTDVGACALERRFIKWYGRKDLNEGILHNRTDGGEGAGRVLRAPLSESSRLKISESKKGKSIHSEDHKKWLSDNTIFNSHEFIEKLRTHNTGLTRSDECKLKIGMTHKGRKRSDEAKAKMSAAGKGKIAWNKGMTAPYTLSDETKQKISESSKGKKRPPRSDEWLQKQKESQKATPRVTCEYCNMTLSVQNHSRFHGIKCKKNVGTEVLSQHLSIVS